MCFPTPAGCWQNSLLCIYRTFLLKVILSTQRPPLVLYCVSFSNIATYFMAPCFFKTTNRVSGLLEGQSLVYHNTKLMRVTSNHLCHTLLMRKQQGPTHTQGEGIIQGVNSRMRGYWGPIRVYLLPPFASYSQGFTPFHMQVGVFM